VQGSRNPEGESRCYRLKDKKLKLRAGGKKVSPEGRFWSVRTEIAIKAKPGAGRNGKSTKFLNKRSFEKTKKREIAKGVAARRGK